MFGTKSQTPPCASSSECQRSHKISQMLLVITFILARVGAKTQERPGLAF